MSECAEWLILKNSSFLYQLEKTDFLLFSLPPLRPLAGTPEFPASSPSAMQPVVTESGRKLYKNLARKKKRHRKFKLSLGFGQKYIYEGNWRPDKSRHLDWARRASLYGGKWSFSIKKKFHFVYIFF